MARPMPVPAPVTSATLPLSFMLELVPLPYFDVPEQRPTEPVVQLQADGARLRSGGVARALGHHLRVQAHANQIVMRFDLQDVPVIRALHADLCGREQVHAAR